MPHAKSTCAWHSVVRVEEYALAPVIHPLIISEHHCFFYPRNLQPAPKQSILWSLKTLWVFFVSNWNRSSYLWWTTPTNLEKSDLKRNIGLHTNNILKVSLTLSQISEEDRLKIEKKLFNINESKIFLKSLIQLLKFFFVKLKYI